jgi:hypothetical protein
VSGIVMTMTEKVKLLLSSLRGSTAYALQTRGTEPWELRFLEDLENKWIRMITDFNLPKMKAMEISMEDLRYKYGIASFANHVRRMKMRFVGHIMRRDEDYLPRQVMLGRFFPETEGGEGEEYAVLYEKRGTELDETRQLELLDEVKLELQRVGFSEEQMVDLWKDRKGYEKVIADIYCSAVIRGWRNSKWWAEDEERVRMEKEEDFLRRNGGSDVEMNGLVEVRAELSKSHENNEQQNAHVELSARAESSRKDFELRRQRRLKSDIKEALKNNEDFFTEAWSRKPKTLDQLTRLRKPTVMKKRGKPKYHCKLCNKYYSTNLFAMERHAESHRNNNPIKCYRVKNSSSDYRPEEHIWNTHTRDFFAGSDARLHSVEPPQDMMAGEDEISCRRCRKKTATWPANADAHAKSAILAKMIEHEKFCAGKL